MLRQDHFVLPYADLTSRLDDEGVKAQAKAIRERFHNRKIIASIDGDEPFSGMILKLRAFQRFLQECPQHQYRVGLLQHVLSHKIGADHGADSETVRELKQLAEEMNKAYGQGLSLVVIEEGDLNVDGRLSLLQAADVLLDTSINDGLNLNPWVFCCAHSRDMSGSMIVSEFSGCSSFVTGAAKVNPWNTQQVMNALHKVMTEDPREMKERFAKDISYASSQNLTDWAMANLSDLKAEAKRDTSGPESGLGAGSQMMFMDYGFRHLDFESVLAAYREARTRVIFLDNEGTLSTDLRGLLRPNNGRTAINLNLRVQPLDPEVLDNLKMLVADKSNAVVVLSGRDKNVVNNWFGSVEGIGMCAEHGFHYVMPGKFQPKNIPSDERWQCMRKGLSEDDDWKAVVYEVMRQYTKRVQGSVTDSKGSGIVWDYRKVGAHLICKDIAMDLERFLDPVKNPDAILRGYPIVVVHGKGYVEVKRKDVDKGVAVSRVLEAVQNHLGRIDFILCIGDDRSDEDMFRVVNKFAKEHEHSEEVNDDGDSNFGGCSSRRRRPPSECSLSAVSQHKPTKKSSITIEDYNAGRNHSKFYTITVGRKPSTAEYFVKDPTEVAELLTKLASQANAKKFARYASMPTLAQKEDDEDSTFGMD